MSKNNFDIPLFSSFTGNDGKKRDINELESYINNLEKNSQVKKKLKVGDVVKLIGNGYTIKIEFVKYKIKELGYVDYAGKRIDNEVNDDKLYIFNQKDIEQIIEEVDKEEEK